MSHVVKGMCPMSTIGYRNTNNDNLHIIHNYTIRIVTYLAAAICDIQSLLSQ